MFEMALTTELLLINEVASKASADSDGGADEARVGGGRGDPQTPVRGGGGGGGGGGESKGLSEYFIKLRF
tara:strand:- start:1465 stop:1674 length:210 start_codon:yes stop_codon:yes gene_type:complete